jgi:hypothetical protein
MLISVFVVDQMNQPASVALNSKFELGLYEAARTFIRPVTKWTTAQGTKHQISSANLAPFKDSGIRSDSLKMSEVASSSTACGP